MCQNKFVNKKKINKILDKKKVFMCSSVHVWSDTRIFFKEVSTLSASDYSIDLYAVSDKKNNTEIELPENVNLTIFSLGGKIKRPQRWKILYKEALASNALYYHFHDPELLFLIPKIKKNKPTCKIIYDMHENFPKMLTTKEWIPRFIRIPTSKIAQNLEKKWLPMCDAVVFAESSYKNDYSYLNIEQCDLLNYPTKQDKLTKEKSSSYTFIYVGDLVEDRGLFEMLSLIKSLKLRGHNKVQLKLIGPMQDQLKVKVTAFISENNLFDNVIVYGRLPYSQIWKHYANSNVGLCLLHPIPNYLNSLATKLFEYMAAGLPILATNIPDWVELISSTETGYTTNIDNVMEIANLAEIMMSNEKECEKFARNGRYFHENKFNWQSESEKLINLYDKLS